MVAITQAVAIYGALLFVLLLWLRLPNVPRSLGVLQPLLFLLSQPLRTRLPSDPSRPKQSPQKRRSALVRRLLRWLSAQMLRRGRWSLRWLRPALLLRSLLLPLWSLPQLPPRPCLP